MAFAASSQSLSRPSFLILTGQRCELHSSLAICTRNHPTSVPRSLRTPMARFQRPPKLVMHMNNVKEKLSEVVPPSVKNLPWKKAEDVAMQQFLLLAQEALKWSLLALYVCSSVSDVIFSVSRDKELMIPFGLFVGYMMTNFLMETSQELFPISGERGWRWHLLGIGCFFGLIKILSAFFAVQGRIFLLHAVNGGLMQVLWLWRSFLEKEDGNSRDNSMQHNASVARNAE
ncbi:hypothetical protein U1Q18_005411 [Sarracenia purpurea var. burkii]